MTKVKKQNFWNKERIAHLTAIMEFQDRPKEDNIKVAMESFKVSKNSVLMAYRRRHGNIDYKLIGRSSKKTSHIVKAISVIKGKNPFKIMNDILLTSSRGITNPMAGLLLDQIFKLQANDARSSVNIPTTVCPEKKDASALVNSVRRLISENSNKALRNTVITLKTILKDGTEEYAGTRVFRRS